MFRLILKIPFWPNPSLMRYTQIREMVFTNLININHEIIAYMIYVMLHNTLALLIVKGVIS